MDKAERARRSQEVLEACARWDGLREMAAKPDARAREVYDLARDAPDGDAFFAGLKRLAARDVDEMLSLLRQLVEEPGMNYEAVAEAARKLAAAAALLADD